MINFIIFTNFSNIKSSVVRFRCIFNKLFVFKNYIHVYLL
eukprot:UN05461